MAKALVSGSERNLKLFTDCMYFINGHCKLNDKCRYRHCPEAAQQTNNCFKWPKTCRNVKCPYRHPVPPPVKTEERKPSSKSESSATRFSPPIVSAPIRQEGQKPFDIVQRIRQKLVIETGIREYSFTCYCNSTTISQDNQLNLCDANVRIVHVPDRKPGAVDRQIMLELDRFERAHRPPATIVLISGDIDFVGKLSDLRHQAGFHVIVIHNKPAKSELKATVNAHYPWEIFTQSPPKPPVVASGFNPPISELTTRIPQSYRLNSSNANGTLHRVDPSPARSTPIVRTRSASAKKPTHHCPKCTSEFDSIQALRQHQEAKDHLFDCPLCDESFVTLDGQTQHQKAKGHYEAQYLCDGCNRRFTKLDSVLQHIQATGHSGFTGPASSDTNDVFRNPSTIPKNNNDLVQETTSFIINQGIDALVQHLPKMFRKKK